MAEIVGLLGNRQVRIATGELDAAGRRTQQSGDEAEQRGFACAVGAGHQQGFPACDLKTEVAEDLTATAQTGEIPRRQPHHPKPALQYQASPSIAFAGSRSVPRDRRETLNLRP